MRYFKGPVELIESVKTKHDWRPYIVDNWRENKGVSRAWNMGIEKAKAEGYDYTLICNDDILLAPSTIDALVDLFDRSDDSVQMVTAHNIRFELDDPYKILSLPDRTEGEPSEGPDFACFMVKSDFIDKCGPFDWNFWPGYFEDNDMHYRMKLLGYKALVTPRAPYFHFGSVTQNLDPSNVACPPEQFEKNRAYFVEKWGGVPGHEAFTSPYNDPAFDIKGFKK